MQKRCVLPAHQPPRQLPLKELGMMLPGAVTKSPGAFQCWRMEEESRRHLKSWHSKE